MRESELIVRFQPETRHVYVLPGTTILEAADRANLIIDTPCGGQGTCGRCRVTVTENPPEPTAAERERLSADELAGGVRLACQAEVHTGMTVEVPVESRFFGQKILAHGTGAARELEPCVAPDPDDRSGRLYGTAFDVGTTTVVGTLLDLTTGRTLAVAARPNPQIPLGDDVISRINHAGKEGGVEELRRPLLDAVNAMIAEMCEEAKAPVESIYEAAFGGNTTMHHLLLGIDPTPLGHAPYEAVVLDSRTVPARELGVRIRPTGRAYTMPNIAGYVGGDTVGVILAAAMADYDGVQLALDIGTNGEIVLGGAERLIACSTAAGPAFEGARLDHGMRAAPGAIESVRLDHDVRIGVIEDAPPRGICGSGVIDAIAVLLEAGILDSTGRLLTPDELPDGLHDGLRRRITEFNGGPAFVLADADDSATGRPVCLTQRDIREVQLGKGAIRAGTEIVLAEYGVSIEDVDRVLLAGAFGNFARPRSVIRMGLLPGMPTSKVEFIGNAAGTGVQMALAGRRCREQADRIARETEYIELAGRPDFQMKFAEAMIFPSP